jgi:hypothetical protein
MLVMLKIKINAYVFIGFITLTCSCHSKTTPPEIPAFTFTVEQAPEWTALFKRNHGWFGGDGIFCATIHGNEQQGGANNDSTLIWFSDSMIGDIINDSLQPGFSMINNSIAVLAGGKPDSNAIRFFWNKEGKNKDSAVSIVTPQTPATERGEYYWLGDGFVNTEMNNDLFIFGYRIQNIPEQAVLGFKQTGTALLRTSVAERTTFLHTKQTDLPFLQSNNIDSSGTFGAAILVNTTKAGAPDADGYVYIYGIRGKNKEVIAARVKAEAMEEFDQWMFWNGSEWTSDINTIKPITDHASNEFSMTAIDKGRYVMVFQKNAMSSVVALRVGSSPVGPFGDIVEVYDTRPDLKDSPNFISYNAKAHPVLSLPGELLISYNINSFDYANDIKKFPQFYRPRFIKLRYK